MPPPEDLVHERTIGALFDPVSLGEAVRDVLLAARFASANVTRVDARAPRDAAQADFFEHVLTTDADLRRSLAGLALTGLDVAYFKARVVHGHALVTVTVDERVDDATEILLRAGADLGNIGRDAAMGTLAPVALLGTTELRA